MTVNGISDQPSSKIGLALSGGGYRAAAFHLGTLRKLKDLGILNHIDVISTVSGGSIIGAFYTLHNEDFDQFEKDFSSLLKKSVVKRVLMSWIFIRLIIISILFIILSFYLLLFSQYPWIFLLLLLGMLFLILKYQFKIFPVSKIIEQIYDEFFFKRVVLGKLPEKPILAINSSNLQTGRLFTFSKNRMGDSTYSNEKVIFDSSQFPIARAVMASSCVPFAFTPVSIDNKFITKSDWDSVNRPLLIDGGIYDNQGIHKLTQRNNPPNYLNIYECDIIIVSDAGNKMSFGDSYRNIITLLSRTCDLFMKRIKMFQIMQNLYQNSWGANKEISYISLSWDLERLIPGFVRNLREGNITDNVRESHCLTDEFILNHSDDQIAKYLEERIGFSQIVYKKLTKDEVKIARSVRTNLTALSSLQIRALSKFAEIQTEVQLKLYCPSLIYDLRINQ